MFGFAREILDGLGTALFGESEIVFRQVRHDPALLSRTVARTFTTLTFVEKFASFRLKRLIVLGGQKSLRHPCGSRR